MNAQGKEEVYYLTSDWEEILTNKEIFYIEAKKNDTFVHCENKKVCTRRSLKMWEHELKSFGFIRVHKSYLVNMEEIQYVKKRLYLKSGALLPIGRAYKPMLEEIYKDFVIAQKQIF